MIAEMDKRIAKSEASMITEMDKRFAKSEASMIAEMDKRLAKSEASMIAEMDKRLAKSEASMIAEMDKRLAKSENLVLEELERTRRILDQKIQNMQDNLDAITEYYRITKLEQDNTVLFLGMVSDLQKRVEKLEQKIA
ncbi:MAG: hypothetical protein HFG70_12730, partial [Hungatella sp.]|nr:hypothetical protein [Hungatella sp.]